MDGWDIMADLVVESIRFYQYNYTKKQKNQQNLKNQKSQINQKNQMIIRQEAIIQQEETIQVEIVVLLLIM